MWKFKIHVKLEKNKNERLGKYRHIKYYQGRQDNIYSIVQMFKAGVKQCGN